MLHLTQKVSRQESIMPAICHTLNQLGKQSNPQWILRRSVLKELGTQKSQEGLEGRYS